MKLKKAFPTLILSLICLLLFLQNQEAKSIRQDINALDVWMESEFEGSKNMLVYYLQAKEFDFLDLRQLTRFQMAAMYGRYMEHNKLGGDPEWSSLAQALDLLKHDEIFNRLTDADFDMILTFLNNHSYRNEPVITQADLAPIVDRFECLLNALSKDRETVSPS